MTRLSQEEGLISPNDWKLNAEGQSDFQEEVRLSEHQRCERTRVP